MSLENWMNEVSNLQFTWFVKRLSGNDTGATKSHQVGLYVPKSIMFKVFPSINIHKYNSDIYFPAKIDSHTSPEKTVRGIWYNGKLFERNTRDEIRITQWGGQSSPMQDHESTGALVVIAFSQPDRSKDAEGCRIWICSTEEEEDYVEQITGTVDPGNGFIFQPGGNGEQEIEGSCILKADNILPEWFDKFPTGAEVIELSFKMVLPGFPWVGNAIFEPRRS